MGDEHNRHIMTIGIKPQLPKDRMSKKKRISNFFFAAFPLYAILIALFLLLCTDMTSRPDSWLMRGFTIVSSIAGLAILSRLALLTYGLAKINNPRGGFGAIRDTNTISQCQPLSFSSQKKKPHIVILLHGFTSSPMIFDHIAKELKENNIDFHAPLIVGFGLIRHDLLFTLREEDWVRQLTELYDLLASQYEEISVIGHSLGGLLAVYLTQLRPVKHLVVAAPAIFPDPAQRSYRFLATSQISAHILSWLFPFLPKLRRKGRTTPNDVLLDDAAAKYFQYPVAPVRGVFNILKLQARVDFTQAQFETFDLLFGAQDLTVDCNKIVEHIKALNVPHRIHKFDDTAHNPFVDNESELTSWIVIYILNGDLQWPPESYQQNTAAQINSNL